MCITSPNCRAAIQHTRGFDRISIGGGGLFICEAPSPKKSSRSPVGKRILGPLRCQILMVWVQPTQCKHAHRQCPKRLLPYTLLASSFANPLRDRFQRLFRIRSRFMTHRAPTSLATIAFALSGLLTLASCCKTKKPVVQDRSAPSSTSATSEQPGATLDCGTSKCQVGTQICCGYYGKNSYVCKPAPPVPSGNALLNVCGARDGLSAMACDDSGDCEADRICVMPIRWGTGVTYSTQECLPPNDTYASEPERCGKGGVCKRKGTRCGTRGICTK